MLLLYVLFFLTDFHLIMCLLWSVTWFMGRRGSLGVVPTSRTFPRGVVGVQVVTETEHWEKPVPQLFTPVVNIPPNSTVRPPLMGIEGIGDSHLYR